MQITQTKLNVISRDDTTVIYGVSALNLCNRYYKFKEFQDISLLLEVNLLAQSYISGFSYKTDFADGCRNITSFKTDSFPPVFFNSLLVYWF